jgi:hypothetical protein
MLPHGPGVPGLRERPAGDCECPEPKPTRLDSSKRWPVSCNTLCAALVNSQLDSKVVRSKHVLSARRMREEEIAMIDNEQQVGSLNLNVGFLRFATAVELYKHIREITAPGGDYTVHNFVGVIEDVSPDASVCETELFSRGALEYYTKKNMGWEYTPAEADAYQMEERGGEQGDYRKGMQEKIANVIACLRTEPRSKRAIIPIPFSLEGSINVDWTDQGQTKCCRELHFYREDDKLKCTGILRMQNASIFPKNIHFFATLIDYIASELGWEVGEYTHWITNLCHDRSAVSC